MSVRSDRTKLVGRERRNFPVEILKACAAAIAQHDQILELRLLETARVLQVLYPTNTGPQFFEVTVTEKMS